MLFCFVFAASSRNFAMRRPSSARCGLRSAHNITVVIRDRLREMREEKKLSQGDIEKRIGLLRSSISRVENGHTVPAIETLEKLSVPPE
jgi:DNA-binding XRE family transcriptional regulator